MWRAGRSWLRADLGGLAREATAGVVASFVTLAHCLSFSALVLGGDLAAGLPAALWGFMVATAAVTLISGPFTTLPPLLAGPRNPAVAVMAVLATTVSSAAFAKGMPASEAARHVLVALSIASVATGMIAWLLGTFRLGQAVRFVPYPVIGGFLAASGLLLVLGGLEVGSGERVSRNGFAGLLDTGAQARLMVTLVCASLLLALKRLPGGTKALPAAIVAAAVGLDLVLWIAGAGSGWKLATGTGPAGWSPLSAVQGIDWAVIKPGSIEILSIAGVSVAALLLDTSSLEVQRRAQADIDREFRINGAANLAVAVVGGLSVGHALNPSRLIDALGGRRRMAGIAGGLFVGLVLASGLDLASLVPRPVLGGLLVFLGLGVLDEALRMPGRRSRPELALTLLIMAAIVGLGYLTGILLGIVGACLLFAARYSLLGAIRRHVTRAELAAPVERGPEVARLLSEQGRRIHVVWLSGYLFFGTSNGLFESIRQATRPRGLPGRRWVVLDCSGVSGTDASAVLSFQKLANWAAGADVVIVIAAATPGLTDELTAAGLFAGTAAALHFPTRNEALEWCEDELARAASPGIAIGPASFRTWLADGLGADAADRLIAGYLERRDLAPGEEVCAHGARSDTIELVASGSVAVTVPGLGGVPLRVRRMTGRTIVGEMGFFRGLPRAASVVAEDAAVVYVMSRDAYARLLAEQPGLAAAFLEFVVRVLSDRVEAANREISALL
ncbi:MAG: SulP family inorganic anion transporter [Hyphomicrobiaceae bacterium]